MFKRLINVIKSWFGFVVGTVEDPELLLKSAQEEMRAAHARNRERAIQALTQKNNLQQMVDEQQRKVDNFQAKAELALKRGDRDLALLLLKEKQSYATALQMTRANLEQAIETSEAVKKAIKQEEETIRRKAAEAIALIAQWKNAQIQIEMEKTLSSMQGLEAMDNSFGLAQTKIKNAVSKSGAVNELAQGSTENRLRALAVTEQDVAAENELARLEARIGIGSETTLPTMTVTPETATVMSELEKLEARVGGSR